MKKKTLELLSPAANFETAVQAILHGADAVYIGASSHGARKAASNSLEDIERVVDFAHQFRAKVYTTVNTIIYENEISQVEQLCRDLYHIGVDALIVQDMGILRMKIPPIALHASTQCDIRTPEKAKFLEEVGFSQLVLARELTIPEIKAISETVTIPLECFIHGALCVSYSGRCHASFATTGRSANRGECAQICRWPFSLSDSKGNILAKDKYLLSLKDFNASRNLENLIRAGISSFKIEGRLKEISYVKNITALYHNQLEDFIKNHPDECSRGSFGEVSLSFSPKADKSFNRGFTDYFQNNRKPLNITSLITPKSQGEKIQSLSELHNGDGISFVNRNGEFTGVNINKIEGNRIIPARKVDIPRNTEIFRTSDITWDKLLNGETAKRNIYLEISIDEKGVSGKDERGVSARVNLDFTPQKGRKEVDYKSVFEKLGNTIYSLKEFKSYLPSKTFIPLSHLTAKRRELLSLLDKSNQATYPFDYRRKENPEFPYPEQALDFSDNVSNSLSRKFYSEHRVSAIEIAAEAGENIRKEGKVLMTTRHCILRELGLCRKEKNNGLSYPLFLLHNKGKFKLKFDCNRCEMQVLYNKNP